ncbi:energy transducer TonB [Chelonobacter oris]|uniref:Protein TonB n=1 Tax=Chelonobacter oris TaxID=505317 RepID=A0A0A3ALU3_9PAST|nr:energy transducer TonB [Chelonobacter oris]KGQ70378.1 energy transducer TonB [Chelonobacter oris]MDH3000916.1 energy transducer TonB [Chelonobacter oris]
MKKRRSLIGFLFSLIFHGALASLFIFAIGRSMADETANGQTSDEMSTNISIEMMMAMVQAEPEPEPEPIKEEIPEPKEEIPDPTVKPEPKKIEKPKEPEKPKEKPKPKPKEKRKEKPKKERSKRDNVQQGDRDVDSPHNVNSKASGPQTSANNPNMVGGGGKAIDAYRSQLRREIERNKRYPQRAKMMRKQGVVSISFTLNTDGSIQNPRVAKSSGSEDLDKAAIQAVQNARSVGPRPDGMKAAVTVPIRFNIS